MRTLRVLAILTKRQMADDGPYLVVALLASIVIVLAAAVAAFFDSPDVGLNRYLPVPTVGLFGVLLVLVCAGSYIFGARQVHADQASGLLAMVSTLPVRQAQLFFARTMTGGVFLFIVLAFLTFITSGAVLFDLLPGRKWIQLRAGEWSPQFLLGLAIWIFLSTFLVALTSYCLGLRKARTAPTWMTTASSLPLTLLLILPVIIKGFTLLSVIIPVLLIVAVLISILARPGRRVLPVLATGLILCVLVSVALFCGRYVCDVVLATRAGDSRRMVEIKPSGLFSWQVEGDAGWRSVAMGSIQKEHFLGIPYRSIGIPNLISTLGIVDSIRRKGSREFRVHSSSGASRLARFDDTLGQVMDRSGQGALYAGPEGIASVPDDSLGRFVSPVFGSGVLYDRASRRFYTIDAEDEIVRRGQELDDSWDPVGIFPYQAQGVQMCSAMLGSVPAPYDGYCRDYIGVLDRSGRIALLDRRTLDVTGWVGYLPRPRTLFGRGSGQPKDVLGCDVEVIAGGPEGTYVGMVVGSLSRQGTSLALAVFDKDGREIITAHSRMDRFESTAMLGKYLFESLHPPILTLASFFTAYSFEAGATHRALFLMPNSVVALQRDREASLAIQLLAALLFLLPAVVLAGFLSWRVVRDGALLGMSRWARRLWGLGVLAFGLPAYITYRLMRPRVALALCSNCGRGRRVDWEACHHCGSAWDVPALATPAWRVTSEPRRGREIAL